MLVSQTVLLTVPGDLRYRDLAVRTVAAACRLVNPATVIAPRHPEGTQTGEINLRRTFDAEVVSAFSEIFNNIALHGYADAKRSGQIAITMNLSESNIEIVLQDWGASFDAEKIPEPELDSLPEGGMGLHIARACLDELIYNPGPPHNVWRLKKAMQTSTHETSGLLPRNKAAED